MPTYDYVCDACGHEFEHFQSMSDPLLRKCPACKKSRLRRKVGAGAGVIFKGSGFYQTDYKAKSRAAPKAEGEAPAGKASAGESAGGGGCKPECGPGPGACAAPDAKPSAKPDAKGDAKSDAKPDAKSAKGAKR